MVRVAPSGFALRPARRPRDLLLTLVQAPIGLVVIETELEPIAVVVHFTLALGALAGALIVLLEAWKPALDDPVPGELRRAGLVLAGACLAWS